MAATAERKKKFVNKKEEGIHEKAKVTLIWQDDMMGRANFLCACRETTIVWQSWRWWFHFLPFCHLSRQQKKVRPDVIKSVVCACLERAESSKLKSIYKDTPRERTEMSFLPITRFFRFPQTRETPETSDNHFQINFPNVLSSRPFALPPTPN